MSPWFRRKKKDTTEQQAAQAATPAQPTQAEPARAEARSTDTDARPDGQADPAKRRRRGSRGGRGRKKPGAAGATAEATDDKGGARPRSGRRSRRPSASC